MGQSASLTAAHRIGLTRERKGTGASAPNLTCEQVEIDETTDNGRTLPTLVDSHRPETEHPLTTRPQLCNGTQLRLADATQGRNPLGRPLVDKLRVGLKTLSGLLYEVTVKTTSAHNPMGKTVQQSQIGPRSDR